MLLLIELSGKQEVYSVFPKDDTRQRFSSQLSKGRSQESNWSSELCILVLNKC